MESKNLKPRIIATLRAIGEPATARYIADIGMIEEPIHARLKEMVARGDVIRTDKPGNDLLYALPEWQHPGNKTSEETDMAETPPVDSPTEKSEPATPVLAPEHEEEEPFSDYNHIHAALKAKIREIDQLLIDYISCVLKSDPIYQSLMSSKDQLLQAIYEMGLRGLV